jgi:predicted PurR-regulated permease PerM
MVANRNPAEMIPASRLSSYNPEPVVQEAGFEEIELIQASVKVGSAALVVIAAAAAVGLIYLLKLVLVTTLFSVLLAFALDPLVVGLARLHIPRGVGAVLVILLLMALAMGLLYFFYNRALEFADQLPKYSTGIEAAISKVRDKTEKLDQTTRTVMSQPQGKVHPLPVEVQEAPGLSRVISTGSRFGEIVLAFSFVPFLVYFMLTWKAHMHAATLRLFPKERRLVAFRTIGRISEMIRSFIVGNLMVGLLNAIATTAIFWAIGLPYFYFLGAICAFVGLIPYLGIFLALLAPLPLAIGVLGKAGLLVLIVSVVGLHVLTMNVLYPKMIGRRLRLNPLGVALALLFWAWIWGAAGLLLAVPLVGATKIICDYIEPLQGIGAWLGD